MVDDPGAIAVNYRCGGVHNCRSRGGMMWEPSRSDLPAARHLQQQTLTRLYRQVGLSSKASAAGWGRERAVSLCVPSCCAYTCVCVHRLPYACTAAGVSGWHWTSYLQCPLTGSPMVWQHLSPAQQWWAWRTAQTQQQQRQMQLPQALLPQQQRARQPQAQLLPRAWGCCQVHGQRWGWPGRHMLRHCLQPQEVPCRLQAPRPSPAWCPQSHASRGCTWWVLTKNQLCGQPLGWIWRSCVHAALTADGCA